ncbi:copper homeostasis protein CutC [Amycolatopsis sp.]|uniref:copper homeostasis protein CutC n=1 Tax=Amycolatopsis sp. TaxID=37632 RepID=UPI002C33AFD1|nr:copper homeostasis protein CutC [Amycolatopsis sp.]HVV08809.1 copper homeostasis protein CutC [Amycolatopsis sp.]
MRLRIELSTDTVEGAVAADALGADRIELCSAGALGGLTPGPGLLRAVPARCSVPVHVLIRPRDGGFVYAPSEVDAMLTDVAAAVDAGAAGVVVGALTSQGSLDASVLGELRAAAEGLEVTCHRAVDTCRDPVAAVETLATLGFHRVLSSGGATRAEDGAPVLARMVAAAPGLSVMACGGVRPHNALRIVEATGVRDLHAAPRVPAGPEVPEFGTHATLDVEAARELLALPR